MSEQRVLTSESVGRGHPDKVCDSISDALLDEIIKHDPKARVALETIVKAGLRNDPIFSPLKKFYGDWSKEVEKYGLVIPFGEVTTNYKFDIGKVVQNTVRKIGYVYDEGFNDKCLVAPAISPQSPDIAMGVNSSENKEQGAGDQGMMWGLASNETKEYMNLGAVLAHRLVKRLEEVRESGLLPYLRPDTKSQVAVNYEGNLPVNLMNVVVAASHDSDVDMERLRDEVLEEVIKPVCYEWLTSETKYYINATGRFEVYGPVGDSGLTGRKIIVDTYCGDGRHGGGCSSGKDPSKVDRSGVYLARYIAKNIVAAKLASKCELQLAYCIGVAEPMSVQVNTFGTGKVSDSQLVKAVREVMPLKPAAIIKAFNLTKPEGWCYYDTAAYGHLGNDKYPWEKTDRVEDLCDVIYKE